MIAAQHLVNIVLAEAAREARADETMVLVTDQVEATLRWAGNSMTTNGISVSRSLAVISIVRHGDSTYMGTVVSAEVDPAVIRGLVAASRKRRTARLRRVMPHRCLPIPGGRPTGTRPCPVPAPRCSPTSLRR